MWDQIAISNDHALSLLARALTESDYRRRLAAAYVICVAATKHPSVRRTQTADAAILAMRSAITVEPLAARLFACGYLCAGPMPAELTPDLWLLARDGHEPTRVLSSAALFGRRIDEDDEDERDTDESTGEESRRGTVDKPDARELTRPDPLLIMRNLERGMDSREPWVAAVAALAMAGEGLRTRHASKRAVEALQKASPTVKHYLLSRIKYVGSAKCIDGAAVRAIMLDESLPAIVRGVAAEVLGAVRRDRRDVESALLGCIEIEEPRIIYGATRGLAHAGAVSRRTVGALIIHLGHEREDIRVAAAYSLAALGAEAAPALDALLSRVGLEQNRKMCAALIAAISAIGPTVCEAMLGILREGNVHRTWIATQVFIALGPIAVPHLIVALRGETSNDIRAAFAVTLREMGPVAASALPALTAALEDSTDEELAACLLFAIYCVGGIGQAQVPALLRCVLFGSDQLALWAVRGIKDIGVSVLPLVLAAMDEAPAHSRTRLESLAQELRPWDPGRFAKFEAIGNDSVVWTFVLVGDALARAPGGAALRAICRDLGEAKPSESTGPMGSISEGTIRNHLAEMTKALGGVDLTTHRPRQQRGELTDYGRDMLGEAKRYLKWKADWLGGRGSG